MITILVGITRDESSPALLRSLSCAFLFGAKATADEPAKPVSHRLIAADKGHVAIVGAKGDVVNGKAATPKPMCVDARAVARWQCAVSLQPGQNRRDESSQAGRLGNLEAKLKNDSVSRVEVHAFQRLPGGLTMIAESGNGRILEVDRSGKIVHEVPLTLERPDPRIETLACGAKTRYGQLPGLS